MYIRSQRLIGFTFVELIFVAALSAMIFGALSTSFQYTLELIATSRAKLSALSLANERMEFFRSLPYEDVGTLTGLIQGPVANNQTLTMNGLDFTERIIIEYVDGVGDGVGAADSNSILEDYKQIKLEYTWDVRGTSNSISLISNIVPRSIETDVGGGSIRVIVLDQDFMPLVDAVVQVSNGSTTAPLYESRRTNSAGVLLLSGVPVDGNYEITVGGPIAGNNYSTSSTYIADVYISSPDKPAFSVSEGGISTQTFIIDRLSDITFTSLSSLVEGSVLEDFATLGGVASTTDSTTVVAGDLVLADIFGVYGSTGTVYLAPVVPSTLERWEVIRVAADLDPGTSYQLRLYTGDSIAGYTPIPNSDLPGNAAGFTSDLININNLDPILYPTVTIGITLATSDTSFTPEIEEIEIFWRESSTPRPSQTLFIRGEKILGTDTFGGPIYKATTTVTTNAFGEVFLPDMEFDSYIATTTSALDLASACPAQSFIHRGGEDSEIELLYLPSQTNTVRVVVQDALGRRIPGATVRLNRAGYDETQTTNTCGQTFFSGGLSEEIDYDLEISVSGYSTQFLSPFSVSGDIVTEITLIP